MSFKNVVDCLTDRITHAELAEALGCSVPTVRQAVLSDRAKAHRNPPAGWEDVVVLLATQRAEHFRKLAEQLSGGAARSHVDYEGNEIVLSVAAEVHKKEFELQAS